MTYWYKNIEEKPNRFLNLGPYLLDQSGYEKKNPEKNVNTCLGLKSLGKCLDDSGMWHFFGLQKNWARKKSICGTFTQFIEILTT